MFYWHEASVGNDSFCVLPSHHPGVVTTSVMGVFFKRFFHDIFLQSALSQNNTLWIRSCVILIPGPVAWACPTFFPVVTLLSWWLANGCWYKYSQLQRFIHSLQSQPSLQWAQWQLNGVTHHAGNTRKTRHMSYELPWHQITSKTYIFWTKQSY